MWFLIRAAFWFSLVLLMLPFGSDESGNQISPLQALLAARAAVDDFSGICERRPEVCETGKAALHTIGVRAKASAKLAYDMLGDENKKPTARGRRPEPPLPDAKKKPETAAPAISN